MIVGPIPESWSQSGAFPYLSVLHLEGTAINGSLPVSWGTDSLKSITELVLYNTQISGTLSVEWGSNTSFQSLNNLQLNEGNITGALLAFVCFTTPASLKLCCNEGNTTGTLLVLAGLTFSCFGQTVIS